MRFFNFRVSRFTLSAPLRACPELVEGAGFHAPKWIALLIAASLAFSSARPTQLKVLATDVQIEFPDRITFSLQAESDSELHAVELEYGLNITACATDVTRVVPEGFEPARAVDTSWTWDMRQTGSLPPGARLWWRWHLVDAAGNEATTETQWLIWLDDVHPWQTVQSDGINLHWYLGSDEFAAQLLDAAVAAQTRLAEEIGARPETDVNLYIYNTVEAMRDAVLFEPGWTGGQAYYEHNIVIIGIDEQSLNWGIDAIAHELAHLIIHNAVSHCYSRMPTWLDEGLAVYAEGDLDSGSQQALDGAIADDALFPVRTLSDGFSEHPGRATVSYAQSYSLVAYLIETYGQEKMLALLGAFQAGYRYESALDQVYGLSVEELEAEWRAAVGAAPMTLELDRGSADPTLVPTFAPYALPPVAATATPLPPAPTVTGQPAPAPEESSAIPGLVAFAVLACCGLGVLLGLLGFGVGIYRYTTRTTESSHRV